MNFLIEDNIIYDFVNGCIYKKIKNSENGTRLKAHTFIKCGTKHKQNGYIFYNHYRVHRLLYEKYHNIKLESNQLIDHINQVKDDNRIENLRLVNHQLNLQNRGKQENNTSGHKNISWDKSRGKYEVCLKINYKKLHVGRFKTLEQAIERRDEVIKELNEKNGYIFTV